MLKACWQTVSGRVEKSLGYKHELAAKDFLSTDLCRRVVIDSYLDGRQNRQQCEVGEAKCDLCLEQLERHFSWWSVACVICMAAYGKSLGHDWEHCPDATEAQKEALQAKIRWMHCVKWACFACCNYCWALQAICNWWEESSSPGEFERRKNSLCQLLGGAPAGYSCFACFAGVGVQVVA